jgi:hypothetical protein
MRRALLLTPCSDESGSGEELLADRDHLLAHEDAKEAHKRHHQRRLGANVEKVVDDANQKAGAPSDNRYILISFAPLAPQPRQCFSDAPNIDFA